MEGKKTTEKITETIHKIEKLKSIKRHYDTILVELENIYKRKNRIEDQMIKELDDVNRLEKMSVKSIFHNVLGNKNQQLEKERQEYLQVVLQHKDILNAVEVAEFEKDILEKKLSPLDDLKKQLIELKIQREKEILDSHGELRTRLLEFDKSIDDHNISLAETHEALDAGKVAMDSLNKVLRLLRKVRNWKSHPSVYRSSDRRFTQSKRLTSIDFAIKEAARTKLFLGNLNKELTDIGYENNRFSLQIDYISKFPMILFDNLISDWILQEKIRSAIGTVSILVEDVNMVIANLGREYENTQMNIQNLTRQKERFLEKN